MIAVPGCGMEYSWIGDFATPTTGVGAHRRSEGAVVTRTASCRCGWTEKEGEAEAEAEAEVG